MASSLYWHAASTDGRLGTMARPRGGDWLTDEVRQLGEQGVAVLVSCLTPAEIEELDLGGERQACQRFGIAFLSFPVPDRGVPGSMRQAYDVARTILDGLESGRNTVIHCRAGIGRASMLAAATLVLSGVSPAAALIRIAESRGRPVPDTAEQAIWVGDFAGWWALGALRHCVG